MNSFQLKRVLETDVMTKHAFQGVYASDQLKQIPTPSTLPATYVINEDPTSKLGTHWVALYVDHYGYAEYFDSYGLKPIASIAKFINRISDSMSSQNQLQLQSFQTQTCGPFCIFYLIQRHQGYTLDKMIRTFFTSHRSRLLMNDYLVRDYVCHRFQIHLTVPIA